MRLPLNWLKDFIDYGKKSPQELAEIFTLLGHEVEHIDEPARALEKIYVGKILRVKKHPNADKLWIVKCQMSNVKCDIVCGGINLREGMTVAVAMPGARVRWHGQGDLVELKETEIRGVKSVGMICASPEIGLETLFPTKEEREMVDLSDLDLKNGDALAKALRLEPVLHLDITPNRADCLSVIGLARELAAGIGNKFVEAKFRQKEVSLRQSESSGFKFQVSSFKLCPKYTVQVFTNIKVGESPLEMRVRLWQAGVRPINNIVDATNYVMLETGEPTHAFDLDKLGQKQFPIFPARRDPGSRDNSQFPIKEEIIVRNAKRGEKIKVLDGNTYELDETMLVVADSKRPVAIAGVMGGEETGVTAKTKNILLEAAIFDPVSVRKTSRKLGLRSESSARFERGIPWCYPELAQTRARTLIEAKHRTKNKAEIEPRLAAVSFPSPKPISVTQSVSSINQMLNLHLTPARIKAILVSLGFAYEVKPRRAPHPPAGGEGRRLSLDNSFRVQVPWWRLDIKIPEDLYEEVGRIYGLNKLSPTLPQGELKLAPRNRGRELAQAARDILVALGFDEVLSYSFYSRDTLGKDGSSLEREPHLQVANPINPSQELLRTNLSRNLLDAASGNARLFDEVKIFETGKVFHFTPTLVLPLKTGGGEEGVLSSNEQTHLAAVYTAKGMTEEKIFRKFKGDVEALIGKHKHVVFKKMDGGMDIFFDQVWIGWLGLLDEAKKISWKIKEPCALAEFNLDAVLASSEHLLKYKLIPEFPPVRRDIAFVVDEKINYDQVAKAIQGVDELVYSIELFDIFRGVNVGENKKSLAFHITLQSYQKTLGDEETSAVMNKLTRLLKEKFNANVRE